MDKALIVLLMISCSLSTAFAEEWYVYQFVSIDGNRIPHVSSCVPMKAPVASIEHLQQQGADFQVIDKVVKNGKPIVVDIDMPRFADNGALIVNTARFVKGRGLCKKIRSDDVSGKLHKRAMHRYR